MSATARQTAGLQERESLGWAGALQRQRICRAVSLRVQGAGVGSFPQLYVAVSRGRISLTWSLFTALVLGCRT